MSAKHLREFRLKLGITQAEMARLLGFSYQGYQQLEGGRTAFLARHAVALERVSLRLAVERSDPSLVPPAFLEEIRAYARLDAEDKGEG